MENGAVMEARCSKPPWHLSWWSKFESSWCKTVLLQYICEHGHHWCVGVLVFRGWSSHETICIYIYIYGNPSFMRVNSYWWRVWLVPKCRATYSRSLKKLWYRVHISIYIYRRLWNISVLSPPLSLSPEVQSVAFGRVNRSENESNWKRICLAKKDQDENHNHSKKTWWNFMFIPKRISGRLETTTVWSSVSLIKLHKPALQTSWRDVGRELRVEMFQPRIP